MTKLSIQQLRGLKDLIQELVDNGASAIEETHLAIASQPFAVLERIPVIATPVRVVERVQRAVTINVYDAIRAVNGLVGALANQALDCLEGQGGKAGKHR